MPPRSVGRCTQSFSEAWAFWPREALALPVCPDDRIYLNAGQEISVEFGRQPGCTVRFINIEKGSVERRLFYSSGATETRMLSAGQQDLPGSWATVPEKAIFKANTEAVVRFLAESPGTTFGPANPPVVKPTVREFCAGDRVELKAGEDLFFRFSQGCKERIERFNINGEVVEQVIYPSGKRYQRILRTGMSWNYPEWPRAVHWKARVPTEVMFLAQAPPPQPRAPPTAPQQQINKPTVTQQAQARPQVQIPVIPKAPPQAPPPPPTPSRIRQALTPEFFTRLTEFIVAAVLIYLVISISRKPKVEVNSHWLRSIEGLQASPKAFYASVEEAITLPSVNYCRIDWKEAGLFSAYREYLRVLREKNVFDVCGAPFGNGFFVSWWSGVMTPSAFGPSLAALAIVSSFYLMTTISFGIEIGLLFTIIGLISAFLLIGIVMNQNPGEDWIAYILAIPVLGRLFELMFLPPTYYRIDSALMFQESIRQSVNEVIDAMTKAQGLRALSEDERKPIFREFFGRKIKW